MDNDSTGSVPASQLIDAKSQALDDWRGPAGIFNSSLEGNVRRALAIHQDAALDEAALQDLIRTAAALNSANPANRKAAKA